MTRSIPLAFALLIPLAGCSEPATPSSTTNPPLTDTVATPTATPTDEPQAKTDVVRIATYNASLHRKKAGQLVRDLSDPNHLQGQQIAEIVQRIRPDILLINEIDYQADGCLLYTSPSPRDATLSRMPSSA